jgi:hypothetical protein
MSRALILDPAESDTFSKYADLPFDKADLLKALSLLYSNAPQLSRG